MKTKASTKVVPPVVIQNCSFTNALSPETVTVALELAIAVQKIADMCTASSAPMIQIGSLEDIK
jgi:hypothetical protein